MHGPILTSGTRGQNGQLDTGDSGTVDLGTTMIILAVRRVPTQRTGTRQGRTSTREERNRGHRPDKNRHARDHTSMRLGRQSVGHGDHGDVSHDSHDQRVSVSARVRDCRNHHHVYVGGDGEADQRNEDRDLPLRVGDPAVIRSAVATSL